MNKENVTFWTIQNGILFSHKKEWTIGAATPPKNINIGMETQTATECMVPSE